MSLTPSESKPSLRPEVQWNLRKRLPSLLFAIAIAGIGGFVGGYLTSVGPHYLNIHVTEAFTSGEPDRGSAELTVARVPSAVQVEPAIEAPAEEVALPAAQVAPEGAEARLVMQGKNRSYVVLNPAPDATWGTGAKQVRSDDFEFTVTQGLASEFTTPELERWRGRELVLYSAAGYACSARVTDFELLQKSFEDGSEGSSLTRTFLAGSFQLVARVKPIRGSCKSAIWARDASLPAPALGNLGTARRSLRRLVRKEFRQSPAWQAIQKRFLNEGNRGNWDSLFDSPPTIRSMRAAAEELVLISANTASCGEFDGTLSMLYRVEPDGGLTQLESNELYIEDLKASADIDGDGDLDFIASPQQYQTILVKQDPDLKIETTSSVLINYCGC